MAFDHRPETPDPLSLQFSPSPNAAARVAHAVPLLLIAPCAVALIWIQVAQLSQITFSSAALIGTLLFSGAFALAACWAVKLISLGTLKKDLSWLPLVMLGAVFALLGFILVRWDTDDTHYLSNAVYFLAHPETRMGFEAYYVHTDGPPFKALSWINSYASEYLLAAFSHVFNLDFLSLYWSGKTLIAAFAIPFAWYGLLHRFEIRHDAIIAAIFLTLLVVFIMGDTFNSYGNWFITRLFHGKVILTAIGLPLTWSYLLDFLERPNILSWLAIFLTTSAMMGFTTMSGFMLPATCATLILAYCIVHRIKIWADVKRLSGLASAFGYLLAATLYIRANVNPVILQNDGIMNGHYPVTYLGQVSFVTNLSFPLSAAIMAASTLAAVRLCRGKRRSLLGWWCGIYTVAFLTPLTSGLLIDHLTTSNTYWRLFHGLPVQLLIGITMAGVYTYVRSQSAKTQISWVMIGGILLGSPHVLLVLQIAFGWDRNAPTIVRAIHRVSAGGPRVSDVRQSDLKAVMPLLPEGPVLSAHPLNSDIPIFSGKHPQIYARQIETEFWFLTRGDADRGKRRFRAVRFATNGAPSDKPAFLDVVHEEPNLRSIALGDPAVSHSDVIDRIRSLGFADHGKAGRYHIYTKD